MLTVLGGPLIVAGAVGVICGCEVGDSGKHPTVAPIMVIVGIVAAGGGLRILYDAPTGNAFVVRVSGIDDGSPAVRMVCRDSSTAFDRARIDCRAEATPDTDEDD